MKSRIGLTKKMILKAKWHCAVRPQSSKFTPCCRVQTGNIVYKKSTSFLQLALIDASIAKNFSAEQNQ